MLVDILIGFICLCLLCAIPLTVHLMSGIADDIETINEEDEWRSRTT
jgi:hypothetical protein